MSLPSIQDIVVLGETEGKVRHVKKGPDRLLAGDPDIKNTLSFSSLDGRFTTGIWESTPGKFKAVYDEDEFYFLLSGSVIIADAEGGERTFVPGDCIVVPAGFIGTWEVLEPTKKFYAHYRPEAGATPERRVT
jgi:uncharacterized protein